MSEILLVRHAQSYANKREVAFGNVESPLTQRGEQQAAELNGLFIAQYSIDPEEYELPVLASTYLRPQQTAKLAGFKNVEINAIINESDIDAALLTGRHIIEKHTSERWIPEQLHERAERFLQLIREGDLQYQIYFTHGFFIASVLSVLSAEHEAAGQVSPYEFTEDRGYIPRLATVTTVQTALAGVAA